MLVKNSFGGFMVVVFFWIYWTGVRDFFSSDFPWNVFIF